MSITPEVAEENLTIELTTRCTSACRHCFARAGRKSPEELSKETALEIMTEGFAAGFRHLHLTGGEPLLWPGLYDLIEAALSLGYENIFLNSNGHLLNDEAAGRLAKFKKKLQVSVSLQGPENHHDYFRGSGAARKAEAGIKSALAAGLGLHIFTTVDRDMLSELPRFIDRACNVFPGIKSLTLIQLVRVHNDDMNLSDALLSPEDFLSLTRMTSLLMLIGHPVALLENPLAAAAARLMGIDWLPSSKNLHRKGRMVILADKNMTLAHSTRDTFGLYEPGSLQKVMLSEAYQRATEEDTSLCPDCPHVEICRNAGMARPSEWFRDMEDAPFCRRVLTLVARDTSKE